MNQAIFEAIYGLSHKSAILDFIGVFFAKDLAYILVAGFLVMIYYETGWRRKFYLFAEGALATMISRGVLGEVIRFFYYHPRPFAVLGIPPLIGESGASFPSGHATFFFALALVVWYTNRTWGTWYLALAAIMGVARIYAGVHWPFDILGGAILGLATAAAVHALLRKSREELFISKPA